MMAATGRPGYSTTVYRLDEKKVWQKKSFWNLKAP